ncbi:MAG: Tfp pilus assembly protein FimT/FimU [Desulfosudaceae bacterium]
MKPQQGVTVMELVIGLSVAAVITTIGGLGILKGMPERRVAGAVRETYAWLQKSRSEAVRDCRLVSIHFNEETDSLTVTDAGGQVLGRQTFAECIDLYRVTGGNPYTFNSRGMKTGHSGCVYLSYGDGRHSRRLRVTSVGSIAVQHPQEGHDNWIYPGQGSGGGAEEDDPDEDHDVD